MPKTKKQFTNHNEENLQKAFECLQKGGSFRKISVEFGIPTSTLHAKFSGVRPNQYARRGPKTYLTVDEEKRLEKWIIDKARLGFPMHSDDVKNAVQKVLNEAGRENVFVDNRPGDKWLKLFLERHPDIKKKHSEVISRGRASVTEEKLKNWFQEIKTYLQENNLESVLQRPKSLFNGDETGVQLCPKSGLLLGPAKEKDFYEISPGNEKETITVLCSYSAAGDALPPMIMLPYKRIPAHISESIPDDWSIDRSESGWMVSSTFFEYIANIFYPWCIQHKVEFPVIYFLDGHKSHLSLELSEFCHEHQIILIALFPNSTHIIQPCDVAIFRALKYKWRQAVQLYKQNSQKSITKSSFAPIFKTAFDQVNPEVIKNGFKKCGLYPFDENAVDYQRCISTRRQQMNNEENMQGTVLSQSDYEIVNKFFNNYIEETTLLNFINMYSENISCNEPLYVLWKLCTDKMKISQRENLDINTKVIAHEKVDNFIEMNLLTTVDNNENSSELNTSQCDKNKNLFEFNTADKELSDIQVNNFDLNDANFEIEEGKEIFIDVSSLPMEIGDESQIIEISDSINRIVETDCCDKLISDETSILKVVPIESSILHNSINDCDLIEKTDSCNYTNPTEVDINTNISNSKCCQKSNVNCDKSNSKKCDTFSKNSVSSLDTIKETSIISPIEKKPEISDIWKKHLIWPSTDTIKKKNIKQAPLPCVLTSHQHREIQKTQKMLKEAKEKETKEKTRLRKIKKEEIILKKEMVKQEREIKKQEKIKIKQEVEIKKQERIKIKQEKIKIKQEKEVKNQEHIKIKQEKLNEKTKIAVQTKKSLRRKPLKNLNMNKMHV